MTDSVSPGYSFGRGKNTSRVLMRCSKCGKFSDSQNRDAIILCKTCGKSMALKELKLKPIT